MTDMRKMTAHEREVFGMIQQAVLSPAPRTLVFKYEDAKGEVSSRRVEPYSCQQTEGKPMMLNAFCQDKQAQRKFALERMSKVTLGETFKAQWPITIDLS